MANIENYVSSPCLLDELMDNSIIKCDIDFGSNLLEEHTDAGFNTKSSPSHQSDSGCSDMSEDIRSVSPACSESPFLDFDPFECDPTETDLDKELEMYFATPVANTFKPQINKELLTPVLVDDLSDQDYVPPAKTIRSTRTKVVHTKKTVGKINVSQLSSKRVLSMPTISECEVRRPAVKVVKVIKTPSTSKSDINNDIMHALDERNKKNAVQAKMNREKKKAYIQTLEEEVDSLKTENFVLKETNRKAAKEKNVLEKEVEYLRSVLANDSALSGLLKNINHSKNVQLSSTFSRKRNADHDHDYQGSKKSRIGAGVCLHVDQGNVSLEFCSKCSSMANLTSDKS